MTHLWGSCGTVVCFTLGARLGVPTGSGVGARGCSVGEMVVRADRNLHYVRAAVIPQYLQFFPPWNAN